MPDKFLSEEDLDLKNLTFDELIEVWNHWLLMAQATNEFDKDRYSHSCFGEYVDFAGKNNKKADARLKDT